MVILLKCETCQQFVSHKYLGKQVVTGQPMLEESPPPTSGRWECLQCGGITIVGENLEMVEETAKSRRLKAIEARESLFGPDALNDEERSLLEKEVEDVK